MAKVTGLKSWVTGWHWRERILNFTPSWFTICMGTGSVTQVLVNFPYPYTGGTYWMRNLGYCFWILDIVLFGFFCVMLAVRYIRHPILIKKSLMEFPQCSYNGAIPIAFDTIIIGLITFYGYRSSGCWAAFGLYWVTLAITIVICFGLLIIQMAKQGEHSMDDVAGLWLMTAVPLVIVSSVGATLVGHLGYSTTGNLVLVTSFMMCSCGLVLVHLILACYFWRLISFKLPSQQLIVSGFLPLAPLGQGAYAALQMSIYLSNYLKKNGFAPTQSNPPPLSQEVLVATGEAIHWFGIMITLFLLAEATFWLVQVVASLFFVVPKSFNIGFWSFTFPFASYTNAWSVLSRDLKNEGMRGWSAFCTIVSVIVWLVCALMTVYYGFWKGALFQAPGLEEWVDDRGEKGGAEQDEGEDKIRPQRRGLGNGMYEMEGPPSSVDAENGRANGHANGSNKDE